MSSSTRIKLGNSIEIVSLPNGTKMPRTTQQTLSSILSSFGRTYNERDEDEDINDDDDVPIDLSSSNRNNKSLNRLSNQKLNFVTNPEKKKKMPSTKASPPFMVGQGHMCELCDSNFPSRKVLLDHLWKVHKVERIHMPAAGIPPPPLLPLPNLPDIEITPLDSPSPSPPPLSVLPRRNSFSASPINLGGVGRSLVDEIIYHPPASSNRRRASYSSSNGSGSGSSIGGGGPCRTAFTTDVDSEESEGTGGMEICSFCFKQFDDRRMLQNHMKLFHNNADNNRFHCDLCKKDLSSRAALQGHLRIHTGEKPHTCRVCKRAFSNSQTLSRHMRTHTGEKPYECPICGRRASLRHNMKLHIRIHEKQMMIGQA